MTLSTDVSSKTATRSVQPHKNAACTSLTSTCSLRIMTSRSWTPASTSVALCSVPVTAEVVQLRLGLCTESSNQRNCPARRLRKARLVYQSQRSLAQKQQVLLQLALKMRLLSRNIHRWQTSTPSHLACQPLNLYHLVYDSGEEGERPVLVAHD